MKVDAYYVPHSCITRSDQSCLWEHVRGNVCISWSDEGVASAVKVTEVPRSTWVSQPYFVASLGINKNTMLPGMWCDHGHTLHD